MTRTAVDLGALGPWSADATRVRECLGVSLARADGVVSRLDARRHGEASSAFAEHYAAWQAADARVDRTLGELGTDHDALRSVAPALGPGVRAIVAPPLVLSRAQVEKKYADHAADFGVTASRGRDGFAQLQDAVRAVVSDPATAHIDGTYRSEPVVIHLEPRRHLVVLQHHDGTFISGWKLNPAQEANIIERGSL